MSDYAKVRTGKLLLKGEKRKSKNKKHKKHKKQKIDDETKRKIAEDKKDAELHNGWWKITEISQIKGNVAIEFGKNVYVTAMDNGHFTLGPPHADNQGPELVEQLTGIPVSDTKIALKTGFGKYVGVSQGGKVVGISDAIGPKEQWEPVFQDGKTALLSSGNSCFMSCNKEEDIVAHSHTASDEHYLNIRCCTSREVDKYAGLPEEEKNNDLKVCETNYVRKFQSWQDGKLRITNEDKAKLEQAKVGGKLHESLLDRRSKMKADRYCK